MNEPWYQSVPSDALLTQGDFILDCPTVNWGSVEQLLIEGSQLSETLRQLLLPSNCDLIVMTQSCDLMHGKVDNAVLCPHKPLSEVRTIWEVSSQQAGHNPTEKSWRRFCDDIANGHIWNQTFLNSQDAEPVVELRIVDFSHIITLPLTFLKLLLAARGGERIRLRPPYREHLSQAFARYFMRVGLPAPLQKAW